MTNYQGVRVTLTNTARAINEIFEKLKNWLKTLINKISPRLLQLEFKSDNITKSKAIKLIVKKYWLIIIMKTYCISCKKYISNKNSNARKPK